MAKKKVERGGDADDDEKENDENSNDDSSDSAPPGFIDMECPVPLGRIFHETLPDGSVKTYQAVPGGAIEV